MSKYPYRSRRFYERILGVELKKNERVHHKDHNPDNNERSNLEVLTLKEHNMLHFKGRNALYKFKRKEKKE